MLINISFNYLVFPVLHKHHDVHNVCSGLRPASEPPPTDLHLVADNCCVPQQREQPTSKNILSDDDGECSDDDDDDEL